MDTSHHGGEITFPSRILDVPLIAIANTYKDSKLVANLEAQLYLLFEVVTLVPICTLEGVDLTMALEEDLLSHIGLSAIVQIETATFCTQPQ